MKDACCCPAAPDDLTINDRRRRSRDKIGLQLCREPA